MPRLLTGIGVFFFTLRIHYGKVAKRASGFPYRRPTPSLQNA